MNTGFLAGSKFFCFSLDTRRRPRARGHSKGNSPNHAYPRRRPDADNIDTRLSICACSDGSIQKNRIELKKNHIRKVHNRMPVIGGCALFRYIKYLSGNLISPVSWCQSKTPMPRNRRRLRSSPLNRTHQAAAAGGKHSSYRQNMRRLFFNS